MNRVDCLDGLRGVAALWVLLGHAMILTGFHVPLVGQPALGVDLFILLSGFLMVFQYRLRSTFEDWSHPATWRGFWVRRFFRIAPLFYLTLAVAVLAGPMIYADRVTIDTFLGQGLQEPQRYVDAGLTNIVLHLSFLFGLIPDYAFRTPLPDWSLGLEMQFYAVFPFLVLLAGRIGWRFAALVAAGVALVLCAALQTAGVEFPMPSFLPLKMHLFLCGMLIAPDAEASRARLHGRLVLAILLALVPVGGESGLVHLIVREALVIGFFMLVHVRSLAPVDLAARLLGSRLFHWLGELSYGAYLIHLLILQPVAAAVIERYGLGLGAAERFALVTAMVLPATYALSFMTYRLVELPGQKLGKLLLGASGKRARAASTAPEELAAP